MYFLEETTQFRRDMKRCLKQKKDLSVLKTITVRLLNGEKLAAKYRDHPLSGDWKHYRECHLAPDWLLIYHVNTTEKIVTYTRIGSHSELFG